MTVTSTRPSHLSDADFCLLKASLSLSRVFTRLLQAYQRYQEGLKPMKGKMVGEWLDAWLMAVRDAQYYKLRFLRGRNG